MTHLTDKPLQIAVLGTEQQTLQMLKLVFQKAGENHYQLVEKPELAQATIIDLDGINAKTLWAEYREKLPQQPTIILSLYRKDIAGTLFVQKPIELEKLLKALKKVIQWVKENKTAEEVFAPQFKETPLASRETFHHVKLSTEWDIEAAEASYHEFCGYNQDVDPYHPEGMEKIFYDPSKYLQNVFIKAYQLAQTVKEGGILIEGLSKPVLLLPLENQIFWDIGFNDQKLRTMASMPLANHHLRTYKISEKELQKQNILSQSSPQSLDLFLWKLALWTARGRLPKNTDLYKIVQLSQWPNFTRLIVTPHALEITALWMKHPHYSLLETASVLQIRQRYVFALFSATRMLQLVSLGPYTEQTSKLREHAKRGLFQRLLSHLRSRA